MPSLSPLALSCLLFSDADAIAEDYGLRANWRTPYVVELQQDGKVILLGVVYPGSTVLPAERSSDPEDIICFETPDGGLAR